MRKKTAAEKQLPAGQRPEYKTKPGKVDGIVNLKDDQTVEFSIQGKSEGGNPGPFEGTIVYSVDDPSLATLVDNGDGSGAVSAVGPLGTAMLSVVATRTSDGKVFNGAEAINIVAGDVEGIEFVFGEPHETTPDEPPA